MTDNILEPSVAAIPWYNSKIMRGIITGVIAQLVSRLQTRLHFDLSVFGLTVNDLVSLAMDGVTAIAVAYTARARVVQTHAPQVVMTNKQARLLNVSAKDLPDGIEVGGESKYSKQSFDAQLVTYEIAESARPVAGMFYYIMDAHGDRVGISSCLPNEGDVGEPSWGATMFKGFGSANREWQWDGNVEKPTLTSSIHRTGHWHGYLTKGRFISQP